MKSLVWVGIAWIVFSMGCTPSNFNGESEPKVSTVNPKPNNTVITVDDEISASIETEDFEEALESFEVESVSGKLDMVWVIDNSFSMVEKAAQVRKNFEDFISKSSAFTNLKLALISDPTPVEPEFDTSVILSNAAKARGHIQVPAVVGSTDLLILAAAASCPEDSSRGTVVPTTNTKAHARVCGYDMIWNPEKVIEDFPLSVENVAAIDSIKGTLKNFFRPEAKRAYVFVSDDNATGLRGDKFLSVLAPYTAGVKPYVYAFRGEIGTPDCVVIAPGTEYDSLVKESKGEAFDVCKPDWKAFFDKLSVSLGEIAKTEFALQGAQVEKIISIEVDGKTLDPSSYSLIDNKLKIKGEVLQGAKTIKVKYLHAKV